MEKCADIMSSSSSDIGYSKLIVIDIETNPHLPLFLQNHIHSLLNIMNGSEKEIEDMERAGFSQMSLSSYACPIAIVHQKYQPGSPVLDTKNLCVDYRKLNTQLPTLLGNKSLGAVTLVDIPKIYEILAACNHLNTSLV